MRRDLEDWRALVDVVQHQAYVDAKVFVKEFGEAIDLSKTDWDSGSWSNVVRDQSIKRFKPDDSEMDTLLRIYQRELVRYTKYLSV